jgi:hypothetical protein
MPTGLGVTPSGAFVPPSSLSWAPFTRGGLREVSVTFDGAVDATGL